MITKLIGLKKKSSIARVISYIATDKGRIADYRQEAIFHNVSGIELDEITKAFHENYNTYGKVRSNGNKSLHVIMSVSVNDYERMNSDIMYDLAQTYLGKAYQNAISFATIHQSERHFHAHAIVSGNEYRSSKSTRQSKAQLKEMHAYMYRYIREKYPQLETGIDVSNWGKGKSENERTYYQKKRNPETVLTKEILSEVVRSIFKTSSSTKEFYSKLRSAQLATYNYKDRVQGVVWKEQNKKIRFSRLGISPEQILLLDKQNQRLSQLKELNEKQKSRANENERSINWR